MSGESSTEGVSRRSVLARLGAGAAALGGIAAASHTVLADENDLHYHNPTGPSGFGDVTALQWTDGTYYVYGTGRAFGRSEDLVTWQPLPATPTWEPNWHSDPAAGFWAPDVNHYNDQVYLYYSHSTWGSQNNPGIGVATADHPEGPFTDHGPVFRDEDLPYTNCIDSELVVLDGTPYLIWGSFFGIWGVELTADGMDYVPGTEWHLAGDNREGAMIVRENDSFYLFCSTGHCCEGVNSTYEVEVGRSESLFGPYRTRDGRDLREIDDHHAGQAVMSPTDRFVGTGHNTAIEDAAGDWWMLYHIEALGDDPGRRMMVDRIRFDAEGWPVVGCEGTPCAVSPRPAIDPDPPGAPLADGVYRIEAVHSGHVLGVADGSTAEGASVVQQAESGAAHQRWKVTHEGNGAYSIRAAHSGYSLEIVDASTANEADVIQWPDHGGRNQRWLLRPVGSDSYRIENVWSDRVLDVLNLSTDPGANVIQWPPTGANNQHWQFVPVETPTPTATETTTETPTPTPQGPPAIDGTVPQDIDGDGVYGDFNANGQIDFPDVNRFFQHSDTDPIQTNAQLFDFTGEGTVTLQDVMALFRRV